MKKLLVLSLLIPSLSFANEETDYCKVIYKIAEATMTARQAGASMPEVIGALRKNMKGDSFDSMAIKAYNYPRYNTEKLKRKSITDFANDYAQKCYSITIK